MRLLLDTHVLLWWLNGDSALGAQATTTIADPDAEAFISSATVWEIAIKSALGKLQMPGDLIGELKANDFQELPIRFVHAEFAGALPNYHDDPFDRMLVAQAQIEGLKLITGDSDIGSYDVEVIQASK